MTPDTPWLFAPLRTIHLQGLRRGCSVEKDKLFTVAKEDGVFYLDLTEDQFEYPMTALSDRLYDLSRSLFSLELEDKLQYDIDKIDSLKLNGYKPIGRNIGGIEGRRDGFESWAVSCDDILSNKSFPRPPLLDTNSDILHQFALNSLKIANVIFTILSASLQLSSSQLLEDFHRPGIPAPHVIRLLRYAASTDTCQEFSVPQPPHTDLGSLTILFANSPGLQIKPDGCDDWLYVKPKKDHAIVNFGDAMSIWTGGFFRSVLHRVASLPGAGMAERYSFAFLMRPENQAPMASFVGDAVPAEKENTLTCEDWIKAKFGILRGYDNKDRNGILTGRTSNV